MNYLALFIKLAGVSQVILVVASMAIPRVLNWRAALSKPNVLIKQMFWTYAGYVAAINLCFGLLSYFAAGDLVDGSKLALCVTGFIAAYWLTRILIQFFYFSRDSFPKGLQHTIAEGLLVTQFVFLTVVYTMAFLQNLNLR